MEVWFQRSVTDQELNQVSNWRETSLGNENLGLAQSTCRNIATRIVSLLDIGFNCDKIFDQAPK